MDWAWELKEGNLRALVNSQNQQLVSLVYDGIEFMHHGGYPKNLRSAAENDYPNSSFVMFPFVGEAAVNPALPTDAPYSLDRHGIARALRFEKILHTTNEILLQASYKAGKRVPNPKASNDTDNPKVLYFGQNFTLTQKYTLSEEGLRVTLNAHNTSKAPLFYDIGWHPFFRLLSGSTFTTASKKYNLSDIHATGTLKLPNTTRVVYTSEGFALKIMTLEGFGHFQLWSPPDAKHVCVEPVSSVEGSGQKRRNVLVPGTSANHSVQLEIYK